VRPNPAYANIFETVSNAASLQHNLVTNVNLSFAAPSPALNQARFNWKRTTVNASYILRRQRTDSTGAFGVSPTGTLATEWGPGPEDIRQRWLMGINTQALKNMNANININGNTGSPYNQITGLDNNGDLVFNDRPAGLSRNSLRAAGQWSVNANINYNIGLGQKPGAGGGSIGAPGGPVVIVNGGGGAVPQEMVRAVMAGGAQSGAPRYNLFFSANFNNLTNHTNLTGYSGNMQSLNFMQPTAAGQARRVSVSMGFGF
jgi:hypothetical protein